MADIFLSYASEDVAKAEVLAKALERQGWCVFWDRQSIHAGQDFDEVIEDAIDAAKCMIVLWSAVSKKSHYVRDEARLGRDKKILVPVRIEQVEPPMGFGSLHTENFTAWDQQANSKEFGRLWVAVERLVGPGSATPSTSIPPQVFILPPNADKDFAADWGEDQYGLWNDISYKGVTQRFRWIKPGSFLMGSPESETGRSDNETQHPVTLSRGYWLADTACTQAFWLAVRGENPSNFKGENRPVERVSWNDTQKFIQQLNQKLPALGLRLPSEAEWEYACRSGSTGAFNFNGELSLAKVNYSATWDGSGWGNGALQQTVDVKTYPANAWGLYEMHGNVWEWCQDWKGDYPAQPVTDPAGPDKGYQRVLRGGSWIGGGRHCRSADRRSRSPGNRYGNLGFRLARGH